MRIIDANGETLANPDLTRGYTQQERIFVAHHDAVEAQEEVSHFETVAVYENGGCDVHRVIDVPGRPAQEAWDEYEDVLRYTPYTQWQLEAQEIHALEEELASYYWVATEIQMGLGTIADYSVEIARARELREEIRSRRAAWEATL